MRPALTSLRENSPSPDMSVRLTFRRVIRSLFASLGATAIGTAVLAQSVQAEPKHAIAMHGEPALPPDFTAMPYVNPTAPRGGRLVQGILGTFDSLNPLIVRGLAPPDIRGHVIEGLMARGYDEPFTLYGLIAQSVD